MGNKTGPAAPGSNSGSNSDSSKQKEEKVTCIVRFRPCEGWTTDYGFDWVREGDKDPFKERIGVYSIKNVKQKKPSRFDAPGLEIKNDDEEDNRVTNKSLSLKHDIRYNDYYREDILRKVMDKNGKGSFDSWRDQAMALCVKRHGYTKEAGEEYDKLLDRKIESLSEDELAENYDYYAWQTDNPETQFDASKQEMDAGKHALKYAFDPIFVYEISYESIKAIHGKAWTSNLISYEDTGNNKTPLVDEDHPAIELDSFAEIAGQKESIIKREENYYLAPIYYSGENSKWLDFEDDTYKAKQHRKDDYSDFRISTLIGKSRVKWNHLHVRKWHRAVPAYCIFDFGDINPFKEVVLVTKIDGKDYFYKLTYYKVLYKKKPLLVMEALVDIHFDPLDPSHTESHDFVYVGGKLVGGDAKGGFVFLEDLSEEEESIVEEIKGRAKKYVKDDMVRGIDMNIKDLTEKNAFDEIKITIRKPDHLSLIRVPVESIEKKGEKKPFWDGFPVISWQEEYENTFNPFPIWMEGEKTPRKYCVPVLSVCDLDVKRKKYTYGGLYDAPKEEDITCNTEYKLQYFIEGKVPHKLELKTSSGYLRFSPERVFTNPEEKGEITIRYIGRDAVKEPITVDVIAFDDNNQRIGKVGSLRIIVQKKIDVYTTFVKIRVRKKSKNGKKGELVPFSEEFSNCIKQQQEFMQTILFQFGAKVHFNLANNGKCFDLEIPEEEIAPFRLKNGKFTYVFKKYFRDKNGKRYFNYIYLHNVFVKHFFAQEYTKKHPELRHTYLFFFFDEAFYKGVSYATESNERGFEVNVMIAFKTMGYAKSYLYAETHEILHRLKQEHHFHRDSPFCFPYSSSSNIMDYDCLGYSLHKFQWETSLPPLKSQNFKYYKIINLYRKLRKLE